MPTSHRRQKAAAPAAARVKRRSATSCRAVQPAGGLLQLPQELLIEILSRLFQDDEPLDVFRTCQAFHTLQGAAMHAFCRARWPDRYEAVQPAVDKDMETFELGGAIRFLRMEALADSTWVPAGAAMAKQKTMTSEHRGILTEWIVEVVFAMELGRETAFKATQLFDRHLQTVVLDDIVRFQLVGVACLRAVLMKDGTHPPEKLEAQPFAYMTDNTYSAEQVEAETQALLQRHQDPLGPVASTFFSMQQVLLICSCATCAPDSRMCVVAELSWMLLELALISTPCSSLPPARLAMAALSLALEALGLPPHPPALTAATALRPADLQPAAAALALLLQHEPAHCLRALWQTKCYDSAKAAANEGNDELRRMCCWLGEMVQTPRALVPYPHARDQYPAPDPPATS